MARVVHGGEGKLLKREMAAVPYAAAEQRRRARGYASKLLQIVEDIAKAHLGESGLLTGCMQIACTSHRPSPCRNSPSG